MKIRIFNPNTCLFSSNENKNIEIRKVKKNRKLKERTVKIFPTGVACYTDLSVV